MAAKPTPHSSAQEAFYQALSRSKETLADMRRKRTGSDQGTGEMLAVEPSPEMMGRASLLPTEDSPPPRPKRTPSQMNISVPNNTSDSDFTMTLQLIRRLQGLGSEDDSGEIICLDEQLRFKAGNAGFSCKGLQSFWTRVGKKPPTVRYTSEPIAQVLTTRPIAVFMDPKKAPAEVKGYLRVVLDEPCVCMFLRQS